MLRVVILTTAGGLLLLVGCHPQELAPPLRPAPAQLPLTGRSEVEPDLSAIRFSPMPPLHSRPAQYRRLTATECQSLALKYAPLADELATHPDHVPHSQKRAEVANLARLVRCYAADEIRNRSAGEALELYYKLAATEGQIDLAASSHAILRTQLAAAIKAEKEGLRDQAELIIILRRRILELDAQMAKLEAGIALLNAGLSGKCGLDPADPTPLWPADPLKVRGDEVDVEQAVATGLRYRPDLNLLRALTADEDYGGELAKAVLAGVNPLLGNTDALNPFAALLALMKRNPTKGEVAMRKQLLGLLLDRERQADAEIRAAAITLWGERASVVAKVTEVRHLAERVADLEKKVAAGVAGAAADLAAARLDHLKSKGVLLGAVADWHVAEVKLRQMMGMLVRE